MYRVTFFVISFFLINSTFAQETVSGIVLSPDGQPLQGATVFAVGSAFGTTTDAAGSFELKRTSDSMLLRISYIGFKTIEMVPPKNEPNIPLNLVMEDDIYLADAFIVSATRAHINSPLTYENVSGEDINQKNSGRDLPYILEQSVGVVSTSDAGAGIGYTGMRIRGIDQGNINVTINGIALNDAESHGVFYVDLPDFASSLSSVQIQRGVGTSTNGSGAFGATVNLQTEEIHSDPYASLHLSGGSFNTQRATAKFGTGMIDHRWYFDGRISTLHSDGFIDRATADMNSYYLGSGFNNGKTSVKVLVFGGREETYQAWYGLDSATMAQDRTFNFAGAQYDENFNVIGFYDNEVDHYDQDHMQIHWSQKLGKRFRLNLALHGTYGRGYYEQYRQDQSIDSYGGEPFILPDTILNQTDLVVRQWLRNYYYGSTYNLNYTYKSWTIDFGGGINRYDGDHYGEVIWAQLAGNLDPRNRYYFNNGLKDDRNEYLKVTLMLGKKSTLFLDYQQREISYTIEGTDEFAPPLSLDYQFFFINPKVGYGYQMNDKLNLYYTVGVSNREPNRSDILNSPNFDARSERLIDNELGLRLNTTKWQSLFNLYYMYYQDQLVLTGAINDVGEPIRDNVGQSYRAGLECAISTVFFEKLKMSLNLGISSNKNINYVYSDPISGDLVTKNTDLAFSPSYTEKLSIEYQPISWIRLGYFLRYIGEQYMDNTQSRESRLPEYVVHDFRIDFTPKVKSLKELRIYAAAYNFLNAEYVSNGYMYAGTPYYFPQAGVNVLAGLQVNF